MSQSAETSGAGPTGSLPFTLRMYAEECQSPRVAHALRSLSQRLERGEGWTEAVAAQPALPPYLRGLFAVAERTGRLGSLLSEYLYVMQRNRRAFRRVITVLAYPTIVLLAAATMVVGLLVTVVPGFKQIFNDFGVQLPEVTIFFIQVGDVVLQFWPWLAAGAGLTLLLLFLWLVLPFAPFGGTLTWLLQMIPVVGTSSWLAGAGELCSLLAILIDAQTPLPEALRLSAKALRDANLSSGARKLAAAVERGADPADAAGALPEFRRPLVQVLRIIGRGDRSAAVLRSHGELFSLQAEAHSRSAVFWIEPLLLAVIGYSVALIVIAMFMPLVKLLNELS